MSRRRRTAAMALCAGVAWWLPACALGAPAPAPSHPTVATPSARPSAAAAAPAAGPRQVTVLALDMSGSMEKNDPSDMRCAAARAFIGLSRPDESVGLIGFTDDPRYAWEVPPTATTSPGQQQQLEAAVRCGRGGNTPTLSALQRAAQWLQAVPGPGRRSVVLLTDGVPTTSGGQLDEGQIDEVENGLVPQFQRSGWHISTIALGTGSEGTDIEFDFLQRIAHDTQGQFTDGSLGQPASAFNLLPAFVKVLQDEAGRSPGPDLEQQAAGPVEVRVPLSAKHLDVIVLCRSSCSQVALHLPTGAPAPGQQQPVSAGRDGPGYGAIFSEENPPSGSWTVTVAGGGEVRIESLVELQLDIVLRLQDGPHPLGQPLSVTATVLTKSGAPYADAGLSLDGSVTHSPGGQPVRDGGFHLARIAGAQYAGTVRISDAEGPGAYDVTVQALPGPAATRSTGVAMALFPRPVLATTATATRWGVLGGLYSLPLLDRFAGMALQGPASPAVTVAGTLVRPDQAQAPYTRAPIVSAEAAGPGGRSGASVRVEPGAGRFWVSFPTPAAGAYRVTVRTGGPDSFGQTLPATMPVRVAVRDAGPGEYARALLLTVPLLVVLAAALGLLVLYGRFVTMRPPHGHLKAEGDRGRGTPLARRRDLASAFLHRNVSSRADGIEFKFGYWSGIEVRRRPGRPTRWRRDNGAELPTDFRPLRRLRLGDRSHTIESAEDRADLTPGNAVRAVARALGVPGVSGPHPPKKRPRR